MPDFLTEGWIYLQPHTVKYPLALAFPPCTSATANDGPIPYGSSVASAVLVTTDSTGTAVTDILDGVATVAANVVSCTLSYPATSGDGAYTLEARLTLDTGAVLPYDARRIIAGDRST